MLTKAQEGKSHRAGPELFLFKNVFNADAMSDAGN